MDKVTYEQQRHTSACAFTQSDQWFPLRKHAYSNILTSACAFTQSDQWFPLRKHAYSNILKIFPPKNENFQMKNSDLFHDSAENIDCEYSLEPPRRGGSNEYSQSMFSAEIRKIMNTLVNPSFTI